MYSTFHSKDQNRKRKFSLDRFSSGLYNFEYKNSNWIRLLFILHVTKSEASSFRSVKGVARKSLVSNRSSVL